MAEIFLASAMGPEGFAKEVVIKVVRSFLASDQQFVQMFINEARLASRLNHANVVQIFDFGKHGDSYYLAMEYVRGASLWDLRRRTRDLKLPFPPVLAAEIGAQVARGLQYAHNLADNGQRIGVVHRDVTPHNVLLSFDGAVKLTDFGIAKATTTHTAPGMLKGKFAYMAPEQSRGDKVDARTDLFALGIVLWELLTGGRLFDGDSDLAVLRAVQDSLIPPPARMNPDVPAELSDVIMKALARPMEERFQSGFELERALANFVLRNAKSLDDTSVAQFMQAVFREEFETPQRDPVGPPLEDTLPDDFGSGSTVYKDRPHTVQTATPIGPPPQASRVEMTPSRRRGVLDDELAPERKTEEFVPGADLQKNKPRTEQMPALKRPSSRRFDPLPISDDSSQMPAAHESEPSVLVRPSIQLPEFVPVSPSATKSMTDAEERASHTKNERSTAGMPVVKDEAEEAPVVAPKSRTPLAIALSIVVIGLAFAVVHFTASDDPAEPVPVAVPVAVAVKTEPPAAIAEAPKPEVVAPPEVPKTTPVVDETPVPTPAPPVTPEAKTPAKPVVVAPAPVRKAMGSITVKANPFVNVTIDKKVYEVMGTKVLPAPVGTYEIGLAHPKKKLRETVTVKAGESTVVNFSAE